MDRITREQRSRNMSAIGGKSTKPEQIVRKYLFTSGIRYRCNVKTLAGKPDIAIKKFKLALNIHGCFWHGHENCKNFRLPKSNVDFWRKKISSNKKRDKKNRQILIEQGFSYWEIWECEIKRGNFDKVDQFIRAYRLLKNIG